jgi:uroporphyrin-III C-methyltransferase/precorrin-2 dehydrogenase/sirohydrochlorin ferrochelatase
MDYLPLFVRLRNIPCLLVGGGAVARRKLKLLLRAEAQVTVVAPEFSAELTDLAEDHSVTLVPATFATEMLVDQQFVIAATADHATNTQVAAAAAAAGIFCNVVDDRELSTAILPALVDRSPLLVAVSTGGNSPVLATQIRQQIETLLPQGLGQLTEFTGAWRPAVKQAFTNLDDRRHFWQTMLDSELTTQLLAGDLPAAEQTMRAALEGSQPTRGEAWIVGAGPGDPELLTLRAARMLREADVIVHDRLVALAVLDMARKDAEFISVGKTAGEPSISQAEINQLLVELVGAGKRVCRLKGGDPFIFGRGGEEIEALAAAGLPWQVVPGITAASGSAAAAGIPLTHRDLARTLSLVTAQGAGDYEPDWQQLSAAGHTVVFYMALGKLAIVCERLIAAGRNADCPAALIENGSTKLQRVIRGTLATLPQLAETAALVSPTLLIVGEVTGLATVTDGAAAANDTTQLWSKAARG